MDLALHLLLSRDEINAKTCIEGKQRMFYQITTHETSVIFLLIKLSNSILLFQIHPLSLIEAIELNSLIMNHLNKVNFIVNPIRKMLEKEPILVLKTSLVLFGWILAFVLWNKLYVGMG